MPATQTLMLVESDCGEIIAVVSGCPTSSSASTSNTEPEGWPYVLISALGRDSHNCARSSVCGEGGAVSHSEDVGAHMMDLRGCKTVIRISRNDETVTHTYDQFLEILNKQKSTTAGHENSVPAMESSEQTENTVNNDATKAST